MENTLQVHVSGRGPKENEQELDYTIPGQSFIICVLDENNKVTVGMGGTMTDLILMQDHIHKRLLEQNVKELGAYLDKMFAGSEEVPMNASARKAAKTTVEP